jgi:hypothetical protein
MGRVVILGYAKSIEDAAPHRQVLLSAAVWQAGWTPQDARLLDHFVGGSGCTPSATRAILPLLGLGTRSEAPSQLSA